MQRRSVHLLAAGVLLLTLAYGFPAPAGSPAGRQATVLGATASLWEDGDLQFERVDAARVERQWRGATAGLELLERPEGAGSVGPGGSGPWVYAQTVVYPALAAPVYGLLGPRGLRVLNAGLFLLVFWAAWRTLGHPRGCRRLPRSGLTLASFFFVSAALAHVLTLTSAAFEMACLFFALALWCRVRERPLWGRRELLPLAAAGALMACALASQPALGLFALPPIVDLLWSRRWKGAAAYLVVFVLVAAGLLAAQADVTGDPSLEWDWGLQARERTFDGPLPFQVGAQPSTAADSMVVEPGTEGSPEAGGRRDGVRNLGSLLLGRHVGLVPYFPFAVFALGLYLVDLRKPGGRTRHLLAGTLLAYTVLVALHLEAAAAAPAAPGLAAFAAVYPVFLLLPWRLRAGRAVLLPFAAAGLWTLPAAVGALRPPVPAAAFELHAREPVFQVLPMEVSLLEAGRLPGYALYRTPAEHGLGEWLVPRETFFNLEVNPMGVWVRGATRSEVYVLKAGAEPPVIRFRARSISAENVLTVRGAGGRVVVRFDSPAKRLGTPVAVEAEPVADGLWRFTLETTDGAVPARINAQSADPRYLGTFLEWEGAR